MAGSCCGGHKGQDHTHDQAAAGKSCCSHTVVKSKSGAGMGILLGIGAAALVGVGIISMIATGQSSPPAVAQTATPSQATKAPPATVPAVTKPAEPPAKKGYDPKTDGVIRHGRADPIAKPAGAIRIATYNIENFYEIESSNDETGSSTPAKPIEHRKAVAAAIHKINADILAVEEVESKETLTKFRDEYLADMGYTYIASIDAGDPRGIEQSILSKFPIKDEKNWPNTPLEGVHPDKLGKKANPDAGKPLILKRSPMRATVVVPATAIDARDIAANPDAKPVEVTLFTVHHKSGPYYGYLREAEGAKVVQLVHEFEKEHPGSPVIVLGDFNARTTEKSVQVYTSGGMIDAMSGVPGGVESAAFLSHNSGRTIDHILLNPAGAAMVSLDTRYVLGTPQRPDGVDWRRTDPPSGYGSDHYPVVIDLLPRDITGSAIRRGVEAARPEAPAAPAPAPAAGPSTSSDRK